MYQRNKSGRKGIHDQFSVQVNKQSQTVDQNYSNDVLFMAMSALQSLEDCLKMKSKDKNPGISALKTKNKEFSKYDRHDYSYKEEAELKAQVQTTIMALYCCKVDFEKRYGRNSFVLPSNYNLNSAINRLQKFKQSFEKLGDKEAYELADDIIEILSKEKPNNLAVHKKTYDDPYHKQGNYQQQFNHYIEASQDMRESQRNVRKQHGQQMTPQVLQFKANEHYVNHYDTHPPTNQPSNNNSNQNNNKGTGEEQSKQNSWNDKSNKNQGRRY